MFSFVFYTSELNFSPMRQIHNINSAEQREAYILKMHIKGILFPLQINDTSVGDFFRSRGRNILLCFKNESYSSIFVYQLFHKLQIGSSALTIQICEYLI